MAPVACVRGHLPVDVAVGRVTRLDVRLSFDRFDSPIGEILVVSEGERVCALDFADFESRLRGVVDRSYGQTRYARVRNAAGVRSTLKQYFAGKFDALNGLDVAWRGTPFQRSVWQNLRDVNAGTTLSYGEFARRIERPTAVRAVGRANGSNPVAVIVPCHRLIGADGHLTGYGGGLWRKRWLLEHEGAI